MRARADDSQTQSQNFTSHYHCFVCFLRRDLLLTSFKYVNQNKTKSLVNIEGNLDGCLVESQLNQAYLINKFKVLYYDYVTGVLYYKLKLVFKYKSEPLTAKMELRPRRWETRFNFRLESKNAKRISYKSNYQTLKHT